MHSTFDHSFHLGEEVQNKSITWNIPANKWCWVSSAKQSKREIRNWSSFDPILAFFSLADEASGRTRWSGQAWPSERRDHSRTNRGTSAVGCRGGWPQLPSLGAVPHQWRGQSLLEPFHYRAGNWASNASPAVTAGTFRRLRSTRTRRGFQSVDCPTSVPSLSHSLSLSLSLSLSRSFSLSLFSLSKVRSS